MLILAAILSLAIGLSLGLLGGGGSILTLPMLVYVLHVEAKESIASSLFVVGVTAIVGMLGHARAGRVEWKTGLLFGTAAMAGAYAGGRVAHFVPGKMLLLAFGVMMLVTSVAMLRGRKEASGAPRGSARAKTLLVGAGVGGISGLVGAGGGFLIVPALNLFGGLAMPAAIGTSLFVIALQSFAGLGGHIAHTTLDWQLLSVVSASAVVGSVAGVRIARHLSPATLRKAFAWFVLGMAILFISRELPAGYGLPFAGGAVALVGTALVGRRFLPRGGDAAPAQKA
ncbi:sulfite exporter TauE/SafE family protein [Vulgatibacter sp.]|uniref:sulfite exporter TauE/SafE family protein n=1 Tax=Vulgatibacter sp. TaxID=1971226 RepID=UPI00356B3DE4